MKYLLSIIFLLLPLTTQAIEVIPVNLITGKEIEFRIRVAAIQNNFNQDTAVKIAICESQLGKYKTNWQGSSAYGLYMFMPKTFNAYCQGDIKNDIDQINCFIKLYNEHKSWWQCS